MLPTLLPGASRDNLLKALREVHDAAFNLRGRGATVAECVEWAANAVAQLGGQVTAADLDRLVLTRGYERLLSKVGTVTVMDQGTQRALNSLVSLELTQRVTNFEAAIRALEAQINRWSAYGHFAVPDTSFYIRHPDKIRDIDFGPLIDVWEAPVRVLVPVVIIDELDLLKESKDKHVRWRAGHTLGVLDEVFAAGTAPARLRAGDLVPAEPGGRLRSEVTAEVVFDPPGHVRLPIADDEIVDRGLAIEALADRKVTLLTYDTGQSTRARFAGLQAVKLAAQIGEEPGG